MAGIHLGHVSVATRDLDRLQRFYERTIGLRLVAVDHRPHPQGGRLGVFCDGRSVALLAHECSDAEAETDTDLASHHPIDHITFEADAAEFDDAVARLVAAGASDGKVHPDGPTFVVRFEDPDGRSLRLSRPNPDWEPPASAELPSCSLNAPQDVWR